MVLVKLAGYMQKNKPDHYLTPYTKFNSEWIEGLNVRPEPIKLLEENIGSNLLDIGLGNDFFKFDTKNKSNKSKNKWVYQAKDFCTVKETINKMKKQSTEWESIYKSYVW